MATLKKQLEARLGRRIAREELAVALGISLSTYTRRQADRFPAEDVVRAGRELGVPPVELLISCGYLTQEEVDAAADRSTGLAQFSDVEIAREILRRVEVADAAPRLTEPIQDNVHRLHARGQINDPSDEAIAALDRDDDLEIEQQQREP